MRRTLHLRKDTLTELAADDLAAVAGGNTPGCPITIEIDRIKAMVTEIAQTLPTWYCTQTC